jgi:hypothetical protein
VITVNIELISTPTVPVGPATALLGANYSFTTGGAASNIGDAVEYQFDWGDGTFSPWQSSPTATKAWTVLNSTGYQVRVRARCVTHTDNLSAWSAALAVSVVNAETVSSPTIPSGPITGQPNTLYTYTTGGATSNLGHAVQYKFDWGDGTDSNWLPVGVTSAQKAWSVGRQGGYNVRARARCSLDPTIESAWSQVVTINIEFISTPSVPVGPTTAQPGVSYTFTTGGSTSSIGDPVEYQFDWGDSTFSPWQSSPAAVKAWTVLNNAGYPVQVRARCAVHTNNVSAWSTALPVSVANGETVSSPLIPSGPVTGQPNALYSYTTGGATSNFGHAVQYKIDWGDGTDSSWLPVGVTSAQKSWIIGIQGGYRVRAKARCALDPTIESAWSQVVVVNIELISTPAVPLGPTQAILGVNYTFTAGGVTSSLGDPVEFQFDWGDSTFSPWQSLPTAAKAWTVLNNAGYPVRVRARCAVHTDNISAWSSSLFVSVVNAETVSSPMIPSGPLTGQPNTLYTYTTGGSTSNLGHAVQYKFDWGDGTDSNWLPGGVTSAQRAWSVGGGYNIRAKARCSLDPGIESAWSPVVTVRIELVGIPVSPAGPTTVLLGTNYSFTTGGSSSNLGDPVEYQFDWGDGSFSPWQSSPTATKTWYAFNSNGYQVRARARCAVHTGDISAWSAPLTVNIVDAETISSPLVPSGPVVGLPNTLYTYSTGGSSTNLGHPVQYKFDWGDGTDSNWLPVGTTTAQKQWPQGTAIGYSVTATARCAIDLSVISSPSLPLTVRIETISAPSQPVGPVAGIPTVAYTYMTGGAVSNIGDTLEYQFDWGDGTFSSWQSSTTASKAWAAGAATPYPVRARARCISHPSIVSGWSAPLNVFIEFVTPPGMPTQAPPGTLVPNMTATYSATGAVSSTGDPLQYFFDFGDGTNSGWLPVGTNTAQKTWFVPGSFNVRVKARCAVHTFIESAWSPVLAVGVETITSPDIPIGPTTVPVNVQNNYTIGGSLSILGHSVEYWVDWGDNTNSGWVSGPTVSKTWTAIGFYVISVRARCVTDPLIFSGWAFLPVDVTP